MAQTQIFSYNSPYQTSQFDLFERILYDRFITYQYRGSYGRLDMCSAAKKLTFTDVGYILEKLAETGAVILGD